jgi:hypothetical protein
VRHQRRPCGRRQRVVGSPQEVECTLSVASPTVESHPKRGAGAGFTFSAGIGMAIQSTSDHHPHPSRLASTASISPSGCLGVWRLPTPAGSGWARRRPWDMGTCPFRPSRTRFIGSPMNCVLAPSPRASQSTTCAAYATAATRTILRQYPYEPTSYARRFSHQRSMLARRTASAVTSSRPRIPTSARCLAGRGQTDPAVYVFAATVRSNTRAARRLSIPSRAPHNNPSGSRAEREKGERGRNAKQPISVWLPISGKAAPGGLDQRAGGHREKIAEGRNQSYVGSVTGKPPSCHGGTGAGCLRLTTLVNPLRQERSDDA